MLTLRVHDGAAALESYCPYTSPGAYVPTVIRKHHSGGNGNPGCPFFGRSHAADLSMIISCTGCAHIMSDYFHKLASDIQNYLHEQMLI